jgi:hypothetical protein
MVGSRPHGTFAVRDCSRETGEASKRNAAFTPLRHPDGKIVNGELESRQSADVEAGLSPRPNHIVPDYRLLVRAVAWFIF